jgi:hypothetical protein
MTSDVPLRCACGALRGSARALSPKAGTHIVCYCNDCQAFARFLGRRDILDAAGGTAIFQMAPSRVHLTSGADALACMRLSEKGMHRFYCGECKTPVGNTLGPRVPFVGLILAFVDPELEVRERDEILGKPVGYFETKSATGSLPPAAGASSPLRAFARTLRLLGKWWLTGAGTPSPFFDEKTRRARSEPRILTPDERRAL